MEPNQWQGKMWSFLKYLDMHGDIILRYRMNDLHLQSELWVENKFWHIASVFINLHRLYLVSSFRTTETVRRLEKWSYQILNIWVHVVGGCKWWVFTPFSKRNPGNFASAAERDGIWWLATSVKTKQNAAFVTSLVFLGLAPPPSPPPPTRYYGYKPEAHHSLGSLWELSLSLFLSCSFIHSTRPINPF